MGAIDAHLRESLPSKFCLLGAAPSRESFFLKRQVRLLYCDRLKVQYTYVFIEVFIYGPGHVLVNNFGATGQIQLILVPIDQKLAELTDRDKSFSKK